MVPALGVALAAILLTMLIWRRHLGSLMQLASLLAAILLMIWLQDKGYLGGPVPKPSFGADPATSKPAR